VCSIPFGRVRFARLLRFIFTILTVDGRRERRYSVRIRWCCTHRLRESVTDAEQLMMVASRASINSYLRRAGNDRRCARRSSRWASQPIAHRARDSQATPERSPHGW
jgi:hypothetical protein